MTYLIEFPLFTAADMPAKFLSNPWTDISWHNDACPCFERPIPNSDQVVRIYVDYAEDGLREFDNLGRFYVGSYEKDSSEPEAALATDSLQAALDHAAFLCGEVPCAS